MSNRTAASLLSLAAILALGTHASPTRADAGFVVICHATNPVTSLTSSELKKALTGGTKQWANGAVVQVGVTSMETAELKFLASGAGTTPTELLSRIQQQVFKGEMRKPVILRSTAECVGLVRSNPGAICATTGGGALPPEAKILAIR